jgi:hypothetical protein
MFVTVTLSSGYGISLGPRFFLIPNVGYASPFEASISELLAGKVIEVSDSATQIQVISNGACENGITLNIGSVPTTTTAAPTTTTAAPTTTTAAPTTTTAAPTTTTAAPETTTTAAPTTTTAAPTTTTAAPTTTSTTTSGGGPACTYDGLTIVCDTITTTTTTEAPTTTTTTTAAPTCNEWNLYTNGNSGDAGCFDYIDCTGTPQNVCVDNSASVTICAFGTPSQSSGTGVNASNQGPCATTTTTTTTTEAPPLESVFCDCGAGCAEYFQPFCPPGCEACII